MEGVHEAEASTSQCLGQALARKNGLRLGKALRSVHLVVSLVICQILRLLCITAGLCSAEPEKRQDVGELPQHMRHTKRATCATHTRNATRTHRTHNARLHNTLTQHTLTQRYTTHAPVQQHRRTRQTGKRHVLTQTTRAHLNINTALTTHQRTRGRMHVRAHHRNSRICVRTRHPSQFQVMHPRIHACMDVCMYARAILS